MKSGTRTTSFSGLYPHLYAKPAGEVHHPRSDDAEAAAPEPQTGGGVVSATPPSTGRGAMDGSQREVAGPLPVLRALDELPESVGVLSRRPQALAKVAQPADPWEIAALASL